jgi:hypothetical protein
MNKATIANVILGALLLVSSAGSALGDPSPTPAASPAPAASPTSSPEAAINIAFDQIDRVIAGTGTPPPLNAFDADAIAIKNAQSASLLPNISVSQNLGSMLVNTALSMVPFVGGFISGAASQAQANAQRKRYEDQLNAMTGPNPGVLTHYAFYNGWTRIEVPNLVVIVKPEQRLKIFINPVKKTYRIEDAAHELPPPPDDTSPQPDAEATPTPAPPPQTDLTIAFSQTDATTIAGEAVVGYASDATLRLTSSTQPCRDGTFTASQRDYFAHMAEPVPLAITDAHTFYALALPDGCDVPLHPQVTGTAPPSDEMYMYRLVTVVHDPTVVSRPSPPPSGRPDAAAVERAMFGVNSGAGPNYMVLSERANIRELTAADASLFDVPSGYTETR